MCMCVYVFVRVCVRVCACKTVVTSKLLHNNVHTVQLVACEVLIFVKFARHHKIANTNNNRLLYVAVRSSQIQILLLD